MHLGAPAWSPSSDVSLRSHFTFVFSQSWYTNGLCAMDTWESFLKWVNLLHLHWWSRRKHLAVGLTDLVFCEFPRSALELLSCVLL